MRRAKLALLMGMTLASNAAMAGVRAGKANEIPAAYRGEWTNESKYCGSESDNLDSVLYVSATHVGFYENSWRVREIRVQGDGLAITYWPREDFTMYAPNFLRLSRNHGRIFSSIDPVDTGYLRCPSRKKR